MKRFLKIAFIFSLCFALGFSISSCSLSNEDELYEEYEEGYNVGYDEGYYDGYEDGWEDLNDVLYDELEHEEEDRNEALRLMFESVYNGEKLKDGETWYAGNFAIRYHQEQDGYLHFDIKFTDFDIKTICSSDGGSMEFVDKFPITCYIGSYQEDGEYIAVKEYFIGENLLMDRFVFTEDGYLTDYYDVYSDCDTLCILVFSNEEVYSATYEIN